VFGERVKSARILRGLSQRELAERAGMSRSKLERIESGEVVIIAIADICALITALRADANILLGTKRWEK
jgi:transcriptional regulator with XRE-family HTH domain